jgi:hypothetical protein
VHNRQKELKIKQLQHKRHLRGSSLEEPVEGDDVFGDIQLMRKVYFSICLWYFILKMLNLSIEYQKYKRNPSTINDNNTSLQFSIYHTIFALSKYLPSSINYHSYNCIHEFNICVKSSFI